MVPAKLSGTAFMGGECFLEVHYGQYIYTVPTLKLEEPAHDAQRNIYIGDVPLFIEIFPAHVF